MAYYNMGSTGVQVERIQRLLAKLHHYQGPIDANFTARTAEAVRAFQRSKHLAVDGAVGPSTWAALFPNVEYPDPNVPPRSIDDERIPITGRRYITLGLLLSGLLWAVLSTYEVTQHIQVEPLKAHLEETEQNLSASTAEDARLRNDNIILTSHIDVPTLRSPQNNALLIGNEVELDWDHPGDNSSTQYILEIRNPRTNEAWLLNVPNGQLHQVFYTFPQNLLGSEYLWRVQRGSLRETIFTAGAHAEQRRQANEFDLQISEGNWTPEGGLGWNSSPGQEPQTEAEAQAEVVGQVSQGDWSSYGDFSIFKDVPQRIKTTGKLLVGVSPTSFGLLSTVDKAGQVTGFEDDIVRIIAEELGATFGEHIDVRLVFKEFDQLLPSLDRDELDMVIASVTNTRDRETQYHIQFTTGYYEVHQVLIALKGSLRARQPLFIAERSGKLTSVIAGREWIFGSMAGKKVAVNHGTTNERAAEYLKKNLPYRYGFTIDSRFQTVEGIYEALKKGEVDYALVDDVSMVRHYSDEKAICRIRDIQRDLRPFYREELAVGQGREEYSIAVSDPGLLKLVDGFLAKKENSDQIKNLTSLLAGEQGVPVEGVKIPSCEALGFE